MKENILSVIVSYLNRTASVEEIQMINQWIKESEENKRIFDEVSDIWFATATANKEIVFDALPALKSVKLKIGTATPEIIINDRITPRKEKNLTYFLLRYAAVFILSLLLGAIGYAVLFNKKPLLNKEFTTITAPLGSKTYLSLPDGTKVWLNAGSTIKFADNFRNQKREVELKGEAYFDVAKNKSLPFIVKTGEIQIRVLGTAFNVKAYPEEGSIETTLVRGSLIVEKTGHHEKDKQVLLTPNQRAIYFKDKGNIYLSDIENKSIEGRNDEKMEKVKGKIVYLKKVDTEVFTAWKDNRIVFRNEPFESLVIKLERWFGVKIQIKDKKIANYHFNGTIENETLQDVLDIIKYTLPIEYSIEHNLITITAKE